MPDLRTIGDIFRRLRPAARSLLAVSCALGACQAADTTSEKPVGLVYVVPFGDVPMAEIERARWATAQQTNRPAVILPPRALPPNSRMEDGLYDASHLLDATLTAAPGDAFRIVGVTNLPLRAPEYCNVIGYARRRERGLVYSNYLTNRSLSPPIDAGAGPRDDLDVHDPATEALKRRRTSRIIAHELGHTYGAGHCTAQCIMRATGATESVDLLPDRYCPRHQALVDRGRTDTLTDPKFLAALGRERMRLNLWSEATAIYRRAVARRPRNARLRVELGVALMGRGALDEAAFVLDEAERLAPRSPQPFYAQAVLFAAGYAPTRAPAYLEAAVARDGKRLRAHRAAGIVYQDLLSNREQAIRHFEAHIRLGGRDRNVIGRLSYLLAPTMLTFQRPSVAIVQWTPSRGLRFGGFGWDDRSPAGGVSLVLQTLPELREPEPESTWQRAR